jgi:hypothetical protein
MLQRLDSSAISDTFNTSRDGIREWPVAAAVMARDGATTSNSASTTLPTAGPLIGSTAATARRDA